jgi:tetratricopeptide (TPR) repeat protein
MPTDKSVGVLVGGLGLCGAACLLAPAAAAFGAGAFVVAVGGALAVGGQALAPDIAADLFSRFAEWTKGKLRDKGAAAKNHDLGELVIMSIANVIEDVIKRKPGGRRGISLLKVYRDEARIRERLSSVAIDARFEGVWEQTVPQYFKPKLEDFSAVKALTPDIWKHFLNEAPGNSLNADEHAALEAVATALYNDLPMQLVGTYRDALQHHPTVFVAVQTAILQETWNGVSRLEQGVSEILTEIRNVGDAIAIQSLDTMQLLSEEFKATSDGLYILDLKIEFLSRGVLRLLSEIREGIDEILARGRFRDEWDAERHEEVLNGISIIQATLEAQSAAKVSTSQRVEDRRKLVEAITSPDPELRRAAYLASSNVYMARATHELVKEYRLLRPALDGFQYTNHEFSDARFEGDLLRAEGKLEEAIHFYERAHALKSSDGFAAVALTNALMDRAMMQGSDSGEWNPGREEWGDSMHRAGQILLPFLEAGYTSSNPAYLPAVWAFAHLWYHFAKAGLPGAIERSTEALIRADEDVPNNPVTLRLLGRNFFEFTREKECAEPYFKAAIDADPDDINQRFFYGLYLTELPNRDADAAAVFEQCLHINPDNPHVREAFAFLLSKQPSGTTRAELMWKHALRVSPKHPEGWKRYGRFLASLPQGMARAEDVYKNGLANLPNDAELWASYAILLEQQEGRENDAVAAYDTVLTLSPGWIDARVRSVMHKIVAGFIDDPSQVGLIFMNEGATGKDAKLLVAGAWLGILYGKSEDQAACLTALKQPLRECFGASMGFIRQEQNIAQAVAAGHQFTSWLDPLSKVIVGELPLSSLDGWEAWSASS